MCLKTRLLTLTYACYNKGDCEEAIDMKLKFKKTQKLLTLLTSLFLASCTINPAVAPDGGGSGGGGGKNTVPVYQGMTISKTSSLRQNPYALFDGDDDNDDNGNNGQVGDDDNNGNTGDVGDTGDTGNAGDTGDVGDDNPEDEDGHFTDEVDDYGYNEHDQEVEAQVEQLVTIDVETDDEVKYFVQPMETFIIEVHLSNPDQFEIQSFTLNGEKYANYMFKDGSTMELLLLQTTAPSEPGYFDYSIDAIKYIDGTEIKDVDMSQAEKKIKTGVTYNIPPRVSVITPIISTTSAEFNIYIDDFYHILEPKSTYIYLTDGVDIIDQKELVEGNNTVVFSDLYMSTTYQYGIAASFDALDGKGMHTEWLEENVFTTLGAYSFENVHASKDFIFFNLNKTGDVGTIESIKLYDAVTFELIQTIEEGENIFQDLLSDHKYTIYVEFAYERGEDVVHDYVALYNILTEAKVKPIIHVENLTSDKTSISYQIQVEDEDRISNITSVQLLKNGEVVKENGTNLASVFNDLLSDNEYSIKVSYTYNLNDGMGVLEDSVIQNINTVAKIAPQLSIASLDTDKENIAYSINVQDEDAISLITGVELVLNGEVVKSNDNSLSGTFNGLLSDNIYYLRVTYQYDLNDGNGVATNYVEKRINTGAKQAPTVAFTSLDSEQESITYAVSVEDIDQISTIKNIELLLNDQVVDSKDATLLNGTFTNLLSNNDYVVRVNYEYDLNNGSGVTVQSIEQRIHTGAKQAPSVSIVDTMSDKNEIVFGVETEDVDNVLHLDNAELMDGELSIRNITDFDNLKFEDLQSGHKYKIVVNYSYDLNDGNGIQHKSVSYDYLTLVETISVKDIISNNPSIVKTGEMISFRVNFVNPSEIKINTIYINNQPVEVIAGDAIRSAIVEFYPEDTGLVTFAVNKITYTLDGVSISQHTNEEVNVQFPVYTDLKNPTFEPVTSSLYTDDSQGILFHFDNELDYEIDTIDNSKNFRKIDKNTYFIRSTSVNTVTFGYQGFGLSSQTFNYYTNSRTYSEYKVIRTAEEFLSMTDGYYILDADIDLIDSEYLIASQIPFTGYLLGNNHKISNLTQYVNTSNTQYFDAFYSGTFCDVAF